MKQKEHSSRNIPISILLPQEEMLEVATRKSSLYIGIPKEISFQENRVALVPDAVAVLVNNGHRVIVETNAGKASNFSDTDYSEAGALDSLGFGVNGFLAASTAAPTRCFCCSMACLACWA